MSVLIDKSVCPHASGQQTAMHVCDERARGARAGGGGAGGLARGGGWLSAVQMHADRQTY